MKRSDRYYMAKYLLDHRLLLGKTRAEIINMLGEPEMDKIRLLYDLGPERGSAFRVDNDWLDIRFNDPKELVVTEVFIRPD